MGASKRDQLIDTALTVFAREGFHATGIDRIVAEAGVARMTLYNHFESKDALILAALRRRDERFRAWFVGAVEARAATPRDRLLAIFDVLADWFAAPDFTGCLFINAAAEYGAPDSAVHRAAAEHKALIRGVLRGWAVAAGARDPEALADGLALLKEGAIVARYVAGDRDAAARVRAAAAPLIAAAGP